MGNSIASYSSKDNEGEFGRVRTLKEKGSLFEQYITDTFRNKEETYWDDNNIKLYDVNGKILNNRQRLKAIIKYPYKSRACCTKSQYIPVALPYVSKKGLNPGTIRYTYPAIKVFDGENIDWEKNCKWKTNNIDLDFNSGLKNKNKIYSCNNDSGRPECDCSSFYLNDKIDQKPINLCDRVIEMRVKSNNYNTLEKELYGTIFENHSYYNTRLNKEQSISGDLTYNHSNNNAYPDCNCANSIYIKDPLNSDLPDSQKNNFYWKNTFQQLMDKQCTDNKDVTNKYVDKIYNDPTSLCVNTLKNSKLTALDKSKINVKQICNQKGITIKPYDKADSKPKELFF